MIVTNLPTYQKKYQELIIVEGASWGNSNFRYAKDRAYNEMIKKANKYGADAIINIKLDYTINENSLLCSVYGTAIKILED